MALRLKDRFKQIPNGLTYTQFETGWDSIKVLGKHPSLDRLTDAVVAHRLGNPWLVKKNGWKTERSAVMAEVESYNAVICKANGWTDYITDSEPGGSSPPKAWPPSPASGGVVAGARKAGGAIKLVVDWLGSGLQPVAISFAEKRASVCVKCPLNQDGGFFEKIGALAAQDVRKLIEIKSDMSLRTSKDAELKSCVACSCWNPLKVFVPIEHIVKHMSDDVKAKLDSQCWVLAESVSSPTGERQSVATDNSVGSSPA